MKVMKKIVPVALAMTIIFASATAPASSIFTTQITAEAATLKLNKKSVSLEEGKTVTLKVKGKGKKKVKWSSSDKTIATVNKSGKVTAISEGNTTVSARIGKKTLKCKIAVIATSDQNGNNNGDGSSTPDTNISEIQQNKNALVETIKTKGYNNQSGGKTMKWSVGLNGEYAYIAYSPDKNTINFMYTDDSMSPLTNAMLELPIDTDDPSVTLNLSLAYHSIFDYGKCTANASAFHFDDTNKTMAFNIISETGTDGQGQELLNNFGYLALYSWDTMLRYPGNLDSGLQGIGFTGFVPRS